MEINAALVKKTRLTKGWTQQQLADIASLSLRTVQRVETTGSASNESISALASSFEVSREDLLVVPRVSKSELQPVRLVRLYIMMVGAFLSGGLISAVIVYLLVK